MYTSRRIHFSPNLLKFYTELKARVLEGIHYLLLAYVINKTYDTMQIAGVDGKLKERPEKLVNKR